MTGKLKIRRRSERWAPSVFVALTGASGGITPITRAAARSWVVTMWASVASVDLGNGSEYEPSDNVGAVRCWSWPDPFDGVSAADLLAVQHAIDGGQWRENSQANEWAGRAVADTLGLSLDDPGQKSKVKSLLATWIKTGALEKVMATDEKSRPRPMIEVGKWAEVG